MARVGLAAEDMAEKDIIKIICLGNVSEVEQNFKKRRYGLLHVSVLKHGF